MREGAARRHGPVCQPCVISSLGTSGAIGVRALAGGALPGTLPRHVVASPPPALIGPGQAIRNRPCPRALQHGNGDRPEEGPMDKDRIEGALNQAKGAVKETAGKLVGDAKLEAEGKADKAAGKVQNAVGGMKDAAREATDTSADDRR